MTWQSEHLESDFKDYASYHRTRGNQNTHLVGIPLIVIAVLSWLSRVWIVKPEVWATTGVSLSLVRWDLGILALILVSAWYVYNDWKLGLSFSVVLFGFYWIGRALPSPLVWVFFVAGWVLQFLGHYFFEKKSPAFFKNVEHLLVGPIWIFAKLIRAA